jgi:hypothetical protein
VYRGQRGATLLPQRGIVVASPSLTCWMDRRNCIATLHPSPPHTSISCVTCSTVTRTIISLRRMDRPRRRIRRATTRLRRPSPRAPSLPTSNYHPSPTRRSPLNNITQCTTTHIMGHHQPLSSPPRAPHRVARRYPGLPVGGNNRLARV